MILIGSGKVHADNLPNESYYTNNRDSILQTLFVETSYGIRFTPVILETIKKSHKTLTYLLRNQFSNANTIFSKLIDIPNAVVLNNQESKYCFSLFDRMHACTELHSYYKDVYSYIIAPVFDRFGYYSPTMAFAILIGLLCHMGETYCNQYYGLVWKHFVRDGYSSHVIRRAIVPLQDMDKTMICDEMTCWQRRKRKA